MTYTATGQVLAVPDADGNVLTRQTHAEAREVVRVSAPEWEPRTPAPEA
jgi:hypothetical protein